jgi:hypothetical protein
MRFPSEEVIRNLREHYPAGARVELLQMDDVQAPPIGTKGTVLCGENHYVEYADKIVIFTCLFVKTFYIILCLFA